MTYPDSAILQNYNSNIVFLVVCIREHSTAVRTPTAILMHMPTLYNYRMHPHMRIILVCHVTITSSAPCNRLVTRTHVKMQLCHNTSRAIVNLHYNHHMTG